MKTTGKRGRPKGSVAEKTRGVPLQIMVFEEEKEAYKAAAAREGLAVATWMRQQLNKSARGN